MSGRRGATLARFVPFSAFAGLGVFAAVDNLAFLALIGGAGAAVTGGRLLQRRGKGSRKGLRERVQQNTRELEKVAREDKLARQQMRRLAGLQGGVLESWEMLPEEYGPLLEGEMRTIVDEVEGAASLGRRRAALRRHLKGMDRSGISKRIESLEKDLGELEPDSELRAPFESALAGRRGELESYDEILGGISMVNAQLEGAESLLANLRGELLALDTGLSSPPDEPRLAELRERISHFRKSLDEVTRSADSLQNSETERTALR